MTDNDNDNAKDIPRWMSKLKEKISSEKPQLIRCSRCRALCGAAMRKCPACSFFIVHPSQSNQALSASSSPSSSSSSSSTSSSTLSSILSQTSSSIPNSSSSFPSNDLASSTQPSSPSLSSPSPASISSSTSLTPFPPDSSPRDASSSTISAPALHLLTSSSLDNLPSNLSLSLPPSSSSPSPSSPPYSSSSSSSSTSPPPLFSSTLRARPKSATFSTEQIIDQSLNSQDNHNHLHNNNNNNPNNLEETPSSSSSSTLSSSTLSSSTLSSSTNMAIPKLPFSLSLLHKYADIPDLSFANLGEMPPTPSSRDKREQQRHNIIQELRATEREFIADCEIVVQVIQPQLMARNVLPIAQIVDLFLNISDIAKASKALLQLIEKTVADAKVNKYASSNRRDAVQSELVLIGPIFTRLADNLATIYSPYCCGQYHANEQMGQWARESEAFAAWLDEFQASPVAQGQRLGSFLIKPVQRICKYPLLLRELLKATPIDHPDKETLVQAYLDIERTVSRINDSRALSETRKRLERLRASMIAFEATSLSLADLDASPRRFVDEVALFYLSGRKKLSATLWVFFTDLVLGLTPEKHPSYKAPVEISASSACFEQHKSLAVVAWIPLTLALTKVPPLDPSERNLPFPIELVHAGQAKYLLYATKPLDQQRFVDLCTPLKGAGEVRRPRAGSLDSPRHVALQLEQLEKVSSRRSPLRTRKHEGQLSFSQRLKHLYR